jgi:hypothetical protein
VPIATGTTAAGKVRGRAPATHSFHPLFTTQLCHEPRPSREFREESCPLDRRTACTVANVSTSAVATFVGVLLAMVFGWSAVAKARDVTDTHQATRALTGLPLPLVTTVGLIAAESVTAITLLVPQTRVLGAAAALILLALFSGLMVWRLQLGQAPPCHCFGRVSSRPISYLDVIRNTALMVLATVAIVG